MTNDTPQDNNHTLQLLAQRVSTWQTLPAGIKYAYLVDYHTYNAFGAYSLSNEEWDNREMIHNFKNNSELTDPISHRQAMEKAVGMLTRLLTETFGQHTPALTLACVPASTAEKTEARFKDFTAMVCEATGIDNGYPHIDVVADQYHVGDSHLPEYHIDPEYFNGRCVLLFDDILATGGSMSQFAGHMAQAGAHVVAAVALGKAVTPKNRQE